MSINRTKLAICFFTIILLITISIYSYGTTNGVITGETVKLRASASLDAKLVTLLSVNNKVEVLGQEGDWYKVKYKDKTGYVYKDYIKVEKLENNNSINVSENTSNKNNTSENNVSENVTQENAINKIQNNNNDNNNTNNVVDNTNQNEENNAQSGEIEKTDNSNKMTIPSEKIIKEDSEIRLLPLINSSIISVISKDAKVTVVEYKNGWVYVLSSTTSGWMREDKLQDVLLDTTTQTDLEGNIPQETNNNLQNSKEAYVNVNSLRVRKETNTSSEIVDNLSKNEKVIIIDEKDDWYKVSVNNKEGYILKKYLSDKKVATTNRSMKLDRTEETNNTDTNIKETEITNNKKVETNNNDVEVNINSNANVKGNEIVEYAKTFLGDKYVLGGSNPKTGFDCSGFTYYVYKKFGYSLNRTSSAQARNGVEVSKTELQLGDLVLFSQDSKYIGHVGIYIGGNNFIHAANAKKGIVITSLSNSYYKSNYVTARRIVN